MGVGSSSNRGVSEILPNELPDEIKIEILSRLPLRAIKRCELVSKYWKAIVCSCTNPNFADLHFSRSSENPMLLLTPTVVTDRRPDVHIWSRTGANYQYTSIQLRSMMNSYFALVNSCHGMICLRSYLTSGPIVILNPVTFESIVLPRDDHKEMLDINDEDFEIPDVSVGFGYHPPTKEYKVVKLFKLKDKALEVRVHVIGSGTWRSIGQLEETKVYDESDDYERTILMSGTLNWIVTQGSKENKTVKVLRFNVGDENFEMMQTPVFFHRALSLGLTNLSERLALYSFDRFQFHVSTMTDYTKNAWSTLFIIPLVPAPPNSNLNGRHDSKNATIEGTLKDQIYLIDARDRFGAYDAQKKTWEFICYFSQDKFSPFLHVESSISPRVIRAAYRQRA